MYLRIAHVTIQTRDHQSTRRIVGSGGAVTAPNKINETAQDNGASRHEKNQRKEAHVAKVELLSEASDEKKWN